jgi:hypothetical protein
VGIGFRADFIVEREVLVDIKSVERLLPVHHTQVLTYLRCCGLKKGFLINFNTPLLKTGSRAWCCRGRGGHVRPRLGPGPRAPVSRYPRAPCPSCPRVPVSPCPP